MAKAKKKKTEKVCATNGYGYILDGDASKWRTLSDERWDIGMIAGGPVALLGKRRVGGVEVCVFKKGAKVMAQSCLSVMKFPPKKKKKRATQRTTGFRAVTNGGVRVVDPEGGVWWPGAEARREIEASYDPESTAIMICENEPMRGRWKQ
ncbi:hypothetical protein LCGC14_1038270 [marine sediment metagenome]|uniref:Uncharacterized protein n=1 Tax=marine sediment metagenome TaxID=412755 RepID=A0A0F9MSN5_9ZZZZ